MKTISKLFRRTSRGCTTGVPGLLYTTNNSVTHHPKGLTTEEEAHIEADMEEFLKLQQDDPFWYERSYINGYYGDLFVKRGGDREDLAAFGRFLLRFGMDLH